MVRVLTMAAASVLMVVAGGAVRAQASTEQEGYDWAKRVGIVDPRRCGGTSSEFVQGCRTFAGEQALKGSLPMSGFGAGPDVYGNQSYSPPRSNPTSIPLFKRPRG